MINFTGTILSQDGIQGFTDGEINLHIISSNKFNNIISIAQVGKTVTTVTNTISGYNTESVLVDEVETEVTTPIYVETITKSFLGIAELERFEFAVGSTFELMQNSILENLRDQYPSVTFDIAI